MDLRKEDLPATIQAFELIDDKEIFIAEQVVNSQSEVETFTTRYTGYLIKAKKVPVSEISSSGNPVYKKQRSSTGLVMIIIILVIVALLVYGFSTGWIQEKLHLKI
ncbi:MAG: hypothetical protein ABI760_07530 [Ferruginibacter sp.]